MSYRDKQLITRTSRKLKEGIHEDVSPTLICSECGARVRDYNGHMILFHPREKGQRTLC